MFIDALTANQALDAFVTAGGSWWVALLSSTPERGLDPASIVEPAGQTRAQLLRSGASWDAASGRAVQASADLYLPAPTADLGVVMAWAGFDAPTGGVARIAGKLATGFPVVAGAGVRIPKESIRITSP